MNTDVRKLQQNAVLETHVYVCQKKNEVNLGCILNSPKCFHPLEESYWTLGTGSTEKRSIKYLINLATSSIFQSQAFWSLDESESAKNSSNSILQVLGSKDFSSRENCYIIFHFQPWGSNWFSQECSLARAFCKKDFTYLIPLCDFGTPVVASKFKASIETLQKHLWDVQLSLKVFSFSTSGTYRFMAYYGNF